MLVIAAQGFHIARWFYAYIFFAYECHFAGQGHDLVPVFCRLARVHVEYDDDIAIAIRGCRRRVYATGTIRPKIAFVVRCDHKFVAFFVVVAQQILPAAHVAVKEQDMAVANGPEIGAGAVVANECEEVVFDKWMQIRPVRQVG